MPASPYLAAVVAARRRYVAGTLPQLRRDLARVYARALMATLADEQAGTITAERAGQIARLLRLRLGAAMTAAEALTTDAQQTAALLVADGHRDGLRATPGAPVAVSNAFVRLPERALRLMLARKQAGGLAASFKSLAAPHLAATHAAVDALLTAHVARGAAATETTRTLARMLATGDDDVATALDALGPRGGLVRQAMRGAPTPDDATLSAARQLLHRARRIVVHETNQAWQAAQLVAAHDSPVVGLVRWTVSGRHVIACACSILERADVGHGPGLYRPETCPPLPHPFCLCTPTPVIRPPSEWGRPMPPLPTESPEISGIFADAALDAATARSRGAGRVPLSPAARRRALATARTALTTAHAPYAR